MSEVLAIREKHDGALADRSSVRLWLRLLSCTMTIEKDVQRRFAGRGATLARFDVLAALDRHPEGMNMGGLSRALLVSNGNVTQLVQKLAKDGLVRIAPSPADRRASIVRLTAKGRADFAGLAAAHHDWIDGLVADMDGEAREILYHALGALKRSIAKGQAIEPETFQPGHFQWDYAEGVATVTLDRPERKNPLTFESYAELRDAFRELVYAPAVKAVVIAGAGGNFSSGGDVHEIIGPLTQMDMPGLLRFTRMTGDLVKAMRACPQPIVAALDGVCVGAGAILAMASDIRIASPDTKTAFLFTRVGLAGCDMGACAILPRLIGQGRASELLFTGRVMTAEEGERWGFHNKLAEDPLAEALALARSLAEGPTFAHGITKTQLNTEWAVSLETAIEMEAQAQAICMATNDFRRAFEAFADKRQPAFEGD